MNCVHARTLYTGRAVVEDAYVVFDGSTIVACYTIQILFALRENCDYLRSATGCRIGNHIPRFYCAYPFPTLRCQDQSIKALSFTAPSCPPKVQDVGGAVVGCFLRTIGERGPAGQLC